VAPWLSECLPTPVTSCAESNFVPLARFLSLHVQELVLAASIQKIVPSPASCVAPHAPVPIAAAGHGTSTHAVNRPANQCKTAVLQIPIVTAGSDWERRFWRQVKSLPQGTEALQQLLQVVQQLQLQARTSGSQQHSRIIETYLQLAAVDIATKAWQERLDYLILRSKRHPEVSCPSGRCTSMWMLAREFIISGGRRSKGQLFCTTHLAGRACSVNCMELSATFLCSSSSSSSSSSSDGYRFLQPND